MRSIVLYSCCENLMMVFPDAFGKSKFWTSRVASFSLPILLVSSFILISLFLLFLVEEWPKIEGDQKSTGPLINPDGYISPIHMDLISFRTEREDRETLIQGPILII